MNARRKSVLSQRLIILPLLIWKHLNWQKSYALTVAVRQNSMIRER